MKIRLHPFKLELKEPFVISHGTFYYRDTLIVEIEHEGYSGYGEATAISYYGMHIEDFIKELEAVKSSLEKLEWKIPEDQWLNIEELLPRNTFLQSAIDCALWDIWGKMQGLQLHEVWMKDEKQLPLGSFTLSGPPAGVRQKLETMNWPLYKVKMGTQYDDVLLECIRDHSDKARFIIDANGGWTVEKALTYSRELKKIGVTFIEQPLPPGKEELMEKLNESGITWYADESAQGENALDRCDKYFDGINFKLMKSGGITPVLAGIEAARDRGLKVSLGCMTESSFGISALAQLSPLVDSIDMDGNLLIVNDPGKGVELNMGKIQFGQGYGIGCQWR